MNIAVYTVIIGKFDRLKSIKSEFKNQADYYLFTDQDIETDDYTVRKVVNESRNNRRESRKYKICPHLYLPDYDYWLYMDGSFDLLASPRGLINKYMSEHDLTVFKHPWYDCLYREFEVCTSFKMITEGNAKRQRDFYISEGYPRHNGLTENGVILRRNTEQIRNFNDFWYGIYQQYNPRDQLSFCYCTWKLGIKYNIFEGQTSNPALTMTREFKLHGHG